MSLGRTIWMNMAIGGKLRITARFGFRAGLRRVGLLTLMGNGRGKRRGDGLGLTPLPGALRRSTTAAGYRTADTGAGRPDPIGFVRGMRPLWWAGSVQASVWASVSAGDLAGALW